MIRVISNSDLGNYSGYTPEEERAEYDIKLSMLERQFPHLYKNLRKNSKNLSLEEVKIIYSDAINVMRKEEENKNMQMYSKMFDSYMTPDAIKRFQELNDEAIMFLFYCIDEYYKDFSSKVNKLTDGKYFSLQEKVNSFSADDETKIHFDAIADGMFVNASKANQKRFLDSLFIKDGKFDNKKYTEIIGFANSDSLDLLTLKQFPFYQQGINILKSYYEDISNRNFEIVLEAHLDIHRDVLPIIKDFLKE